MRNRVLTIGVAMVVGAFALNGCRQALRVAAEFQLGGGLGTFAVTAGEPVTNSGSGSLGDAAVNIGSGSIILDPNDITVTPADTGGGKGTVNLQEGGTLVVRAWIASVDELATVCVDGEGYGPFNVELDADLQPVSVDPSSITLTQNTLDLINAGEFSLCIEVTSPVDGTVTIDALDFSLGL